MSLSKLLVMAFGLFVIVAVLSLVVPAMVQATNTIEATTSTCTRTLNQWQRSGDASVVPDHCQTRDHYVEFCASGVALTERGTELCAKVTQ